MTRKYKIAVCCMILSVTASLAQHNGEQHRSKLQVGKKEKEVFRNREQDSTLTLHIDTLILRDGSSLEFYGLIDVKLVVDHAEIGRDVVFTGKAAKNDAPNFDIAIRLKQLTSLYILARGIDAMNGTRTDPNGNGGNVTFRYDPRGIVPQQKDKNSRYYLRIDATAGGRTVNPPTDIPLIMGRIGMGLPRLGGIPQGQVYSGSPGIAGKVVVEAY